MERNTFIVKIQAVILLALVCSVDLPAAEAAETNATQKREEKMRVFAQQMQTQHGLDSEAILNSLRQYQHQQSVLNLLERPPERRADWLSYKRRFVNPQHIKQGQRFLGQHQETLQRAYEKYGVPPAIITAVIGVETNYGQLRGLYRTMDVLTTIAFSDYRRHEFFRAQLEEFLLLAAEQGKDPYDYTSSYAGAMGYGQFLPSSYRAYAVDFDGDGRVELEQSVADAIGSIGNYLAEFGWQQGQPVALAAALSNTGNKRANKVKFNSSLKPKISIRRAKSKHGIIPIAAYDGSNKDKVTLLSFAGEEPELWMGLHNYYVLSRYNPSHKYVMALYLLSRALS